MSTNAPEREVPTELTKDQPMVLLTKSQMDQLGAGTVEEIQAVLKQATQVAADAPVIERIANAFVEATKNLNEAAAKSIKERQDQISEDLFESLSREKIVESFKALPKNDPKREALKAEIAQEYGLKTASLVLEGSELKKALERPVSKRNGQYEDIMEARKAYDLAYILTAAKKGVTSGSDSDNVNIDWREFKKSIGRLEKEGMNVDSIRKGIDEAMDTQTNTEGREWVPDSLSANLVQDVYLALRVAALFRRYTMPTATYKLPMRTARGFGYRMPEATAPNQFFSILAKAHNMETGRVQFDAEKLASLQFLSTELEQDSIIPVLELMRDDIIWGLAASIENAVINGSINLNDLDNADASGANRLWSETTGAIDTRNAWDGIRKKVNSGARKDFGNAYPTLALLRELRKPLDKYATEVSDLVWLICAKTHIDLLNLDQVVTLEKYGPNATVLQGEIGRLDGIPIVMSQYQYTNLNASGRYDNTTTNRTLIHLINRTGFAFGDRQIVRVEQESQPLAGQRYMLATWRGDFQKIYPDAENLVAEGYNVKY